MALITCPECGKKMSDMAEKCPHCGYSLKKDSSSKKMNFENIKGKWDNKYLLIILIILIGGYFLFFNNPTKNGNKTNNPSELNPNANGNYEFNQNGKYFEFPTSYKVFVDSNGTIYVGQHIDNQGALIPYIMIEKYKGYSDCSELLKELTNEIAKSYIDARILIDLVSANIGNKFVYGMAFGYTSDGHAVVDNRYAFMVGNSMYLVTSKEENVNSDEINNVVKIIIESLKEVG